MRCPNCGTDPVTVDALSGRCATCSTRIQDPPAWAVNEAAPMVNDEPYCLDCGGKPGDDSPECTQGDLAIKVPYKTEPCVCGHDRTEHHPCGSCEHDRPCLNFRSSDAVGGEG